MLQQKKFTIGVHTCHSFFFIISSNSIVENVQLKNASLSSFLSNFGRYKISFFRESKNKNKNHVSQKPPDQ